MSDPARVTDGADVDPLRGLLVPSQPERPAEMSYRLVELASSLARRRQAVEARSRAAALDARRASDGLRRALVVQRDDAAVGEARCRELEAALVHTLDVAGPTLDALGAARRRATQAAEAADALRGLVAFAVAGPTLTDLDPAWTGPLQVSPSSSGKEDEVSDGVADPASRKRDWNPDSDDAATTAARVAWLLAVGTVALRANAQGGAAGGRRSSWARSSTDSVDASGVGPGSGSSPGSLATAVEALRLWCVQAGEAQEKRFRQSLRGVRPDAARAARAAAVVLALAPEGAGARAAWSRLAAAAAEE